MDILKIKQHLIDNPDSIYEVLDTAGFYKIKDNGSEFRCAISIDGNPTAVAVKKDTLFSNCFSKGIKGDIFVLLGNKLNCEMPREFPKVLKFICNTLGLDYDYDERPTANIKLPFGGFYKSIKRDHNYNTELMAVYDNKILDDYGICINQRFLLDGISAYTQIKFGIGYDNITDRITVPWFTPQGEFCGIMGRANYKIVNDEVAKWFPVIAFKKSLTLYGFNVNYNDILEREIVFIGESEKFVLQLDSMDINVGLALGGSNISEKQAGLIKSLNAKTIITCFDEGVGEEYIIEHTKKLKSKGLFYSNKVGYVYDKHNKYIPKNSKYSPTDLGVNVFKSLINECVVWI